METVRRITVDKLRGEGTLVDGWSDDWHRRQDDEVTGSIGIVGGRKEIALVYKAKFGNGDWRSVEHDVDLSWLARPFGGEQAFFIRPHCRARTQHLCAAQVEFWRPTCGGLVHTCTREREGDRAHRRASKMRLRLGTELGLEAPIRRPKHMRHRTYDRYFEAILEAERWTWDDGLRFLERLKQTEGRIRRRLAPAHEPSRDGQGAVRRSSGRTWAEPLRGRPAPVGERGRLRAAAAGLSPPLRTARTDGDKPGWSACMARPAPAASGSGRARRSHRRPAGADA